MRTHCLQLALALVMFALPAMVLAQKTPVVGQRLVGIRLDVPETTEVRAYLGITEGGSFDPSTIAGQLLIIEFFSMYCPHCQREAPAVNRLYQAIEASEALRGRVKMIGIGVGNSAYEVDHFRKHYQIAFPLFPDENFVVHQSVGEVRTPFFIIADIGPSDRGRVLWTGAGNMDKVETFINRLNGFLSLD
ncbi:peroxiredoxin family protein [Desulfosarcina sp.]|uniref:peroxiredoxin family protein n=1 Tax=Desulfosarcina sp. TaxID=2027861 RepID=UPI00356973BC